MGSLYAVYGYRGEQREDQAGTGRSVLIRQKGEIQSSHPAMYDSGLNAGSFNLRGQSLIISRAGYF